MVDRINQVNFIHNLNKSEKQSQVSNKQKGDLVSLSDEAIRKSMLYQIEKKVKGTPDIREDRVQAAKKRLESLVQEEGVLESVAEKLLKVFGS